MTLPKALADLQLEAELVLLPRPAVSDNGSIQDGCEMLALTQADCSVRELIPILAPRFRMFQERATLSDYSLIRKAIEIVARERIVIAVVRQLACTRL